MYLGRDWAVVFYIWEGVDVVGDSWCSLSVYTGRKSVIAVVIVQQLFQVG
jgi:hypothetical protein